MTPSKSLINDKDVPGGRQSSEYGGVFGLIQPPPHIPESKEILMQIYNTDPGQNEPLTPTPFEELPLIEDGAGSTHELPEPPEITE